MASIHSMHPSRDVCSKWPGLWSQGDLLDSLLCCMMFPSMHDMGLDDIAYVLGISYAGCQGMTAKDVLDLWEFLQSHPTLHSNPIGYWQKILDSRLGDPEDRHLVDLAIKRFQRRIRPKREGSE